MFAQVSRWVLVTEVTCLNQSLLPEQRGRSQGRSVERPGRKLPVTKVPRHPGGDWIMLTIRSLSEGQQTAPGTTCGNHRANSPRHPRASPGMVFAVQTREPTRRAGRIPYRIPPYKREAGGSNPPTPTKFVQLDGLFRTLIGNAGSLAGNHRLRAPRCGKGHPGPGQHHLRSRGRALYRQVPPALPGPLVPR